MMCTGQQLQIGHILFQRGFSVLRAENAKGGLIFGFIITAFALRNLRKIYFTAPP
jgi:hypothetical protein